MGVRNSQRTQCVVIIKIIMLTPFKQKVVNLRIIKTN